MIIGYCNTCNAQFNFLFLNNPLDENFVPISNLRVRAIIEGQFYRDENGEPDPSQPSNQHDETGGHQLRGQERKEMAQLISKIGVNEAFHQQFGKTDFLLIH